MAFSSTILFSIETAAMDFPVNTTNDTGPGSLRDAITSYNTMATGNDTITITLPFESLISLGSNLPPLNGGSGNLLTIDATNAQALSIDGTDLYQAFFVNSGNVSIVGSPTAPMKISSAKTVGSQGGNSTELGGGGGGGSAGGAAIFVNSGTTVSISNCQMLSNSSIGGQGGPGGVETGTVHVGSGGGGAGSFGGGQGGAGGTADLVGGGGGGGGFPGGGAGGAGGTPTGTAGANATLVGGGGGGGGTGSSSPVASGGTGAISGNNGGFGGTSNARGSSGLSGLGGGGGGGGLDGSINPDAPAGGLLGGGGGGAGVDSTLTNGGAGGFGAGGGGGNGFYFASSTPGGMGGTGGLGGGGGGGGGSGTTGGMGGTSTFGGAGGSGGSYMGVQSTGGGGGGGSALGGAVFIHKNATFTIGDSPNFTGNSATGGTGGSSGGGTAQAGATATALGQDIFMMSGATLNFNSHQNLILTNPIQSDQGDGGGTGGGLVVNGPGTLTLSGFNNYLGGTTLNGGTLALAAGASIIGSPTITSGKLDLSATTTPTTLDNPSGSASSAIVFGMPTVTIRTTSPKVFAGALSGGPNAVVLDTNADWTLTRADNTNTSAWAIGDGASLSALDDSSLGTAAQAVNFNGVSARAKLAFTSDTTTSRPFNINSGIGALDLKDSTVTMQTNGTAGPGEFRIEGAASSAKSPKLIASAALAHTGRTHLANTSAAAGPTLAIQGPAGTLPTGGEVLLDARTVLDMSDATIEGQAQTVGDYNGAGDTRIGSNTLYINLNSDSQYDGNFSGASALTLASSLGTVVIDSASARTMKLTGTNTQPGGTVVKSATVDIQDDKNLGAANAPLKMGDAAADLPILRAERSVVVLLREAQLQADIATFDTAGNQITQKTGGTSGPGELKIVNAGTLEEQSQMLHTGGTTVDMLTTLRLAGSLAKLPVDRDMQLASAALLDISPSGTPAQRIGALTGSGNTKIDGNALTVAPSADATYDGAISGVEGRLAKDGASRWSLSGTHTYDGQTSIVDGTIAVINNGLLSKSSDVAIGPAQASSSPGIALDISSANIDQQIGDLSGSGIVKLGSRKMTTHQKVLSSFSGDIQGSSSSELAIDVGSSLALAASLPKKGLDVNQAWSTTGRVTVKADALMRLKATGDVSAAKTFIEANGFLSGTGRTGVLHNAGTVIPGASIGTLTTGDYEESGTLQIEVNNIGQSSLLAVSGDVAINPATKLLIAPDPGAFQTQEIYTVMIVTGTAAGQYSTVTSTLPNRFKVEAIYNGFAFAGAPPGLGSPFIQIILNAIPFSNIITGGNAGAVAKCFDTLTGPPGSDLDSVTGALNNLSNDPHELREAFLEMQPSQFGALALAQENNDILIRSTITHRLDEFYPLACDQKKIENPSGQAQGANASPQQNTPSKPARRKASVWLAPVGKYAQQDHQQQNHGYHLGTGGGLAGADYEVYSNTRLGAAVGYTFTDLKWNGSAGDADINSYYGSFYGNWFCKRAFVDGSFIGSYNHYHAKRHIKFPGINRHARNEHGGYELAGSLGTGLLFTPGRYQVQPYARADYIFTHQDSFKEHGAKSIDLAIEDKGSRYVRTDLGLKVTGCYQLERVKLKPYLKGSWIWEKQLDEGHLEARFTGSSCEFTVTGLHPVRSLFAPSIGLTALAYKDAFAFSVNYDAEISERFWENRGSLNFEYRF